MNARVHAWALPYGLKCRGVSRNKMLRNSMSDTESPDSRYGTLPFLGLCVCCAAGGVSCRELVGDAFGRHDGKRGLAGDFG